MIISDKNYTLAKTCPREVLMTSKSGITGLMEIVGGYGTYYKINTDCAVHSFTGNVSRAHHEVLVNPFFVNDAGGQIDDSKEHRNEILNSIYCLDFVLKP